MLLRHFSSLALISAFSGLTILFSVASSAAVEAPKPAAAASAVPDEPVATTASFGDWVLRCQRLPEGTKPARSCEVAETIRVQGQQSPIAEIAIGRVSPDKPLEINVVLPSNVTFPSVVTLASKDKQRDLVWTRCTPGGCFANAGLTDDILKSWRSASEPAKLAFKDSAGRDVNFPVSFKGLAQALDALSKEP